MKEFGISVLITLYKTEKPIILNRAIRSIWTEQILKPNQVVLIIDGPVDQDLMCEAEFWGLTFPSIFKVIALRENVGLGNAIRLGIEHCDHELIARMDTDDVSDSMRFILQKKYFCENPDIDVLGSNIIEFENGLDNYVSFRNVPEKHIDIVKFAKFRCPINHPSVMYKKSAYIECASQINEYIQDDYITWVRMILKNKKFANISKPLVLMSGGRSQMKRRGGILYLKDEIKLNFHLFDLGFISWFELAISLIMKSIVRLVPVNMRFVFYKVLIRPRL